jgi:hypothetical protein
VIKRIAPVTLILALACGGGSDGGTGPNTTPGDISSMAVGDVRVLNAADITSGIDLPAGSGARDYVIIVGNTNNIKDVEASYVVKADRTTGASFGISAPSDLGGQSNVAVNQIPLALTAQQAFENRVRAFERKRLVLRGPSNPLASRLSVRRSAQAAVIAIPAVGDLINLKIPDASSDSLCATYFSTQARVASVSAKAIIAVDTLDGPPAGLFTQAQMDSITNEFDNTTYPTDAAYFNTPTDFDGNGRVIMLYTGRVNKLTPRGATSLIGGFFWAGDFFPTVDTQDASGCAASNVAEIFYLLSPDPTGRFGDAQTAGYVRQLTRGTIAHEFQHMINAGNRFVNPAVKTFEAVWLDEGLAHFAEEAVGRALRGFGDLQTLTMADLLPSGCTSCPDDFDAFFWQNFARLTYWMDKPDKYSPMSIGADTSLAVRGAAWAILRYAADNYSNNDPRAFTRKLVAGPDSGLKNFNAATKVPVDTAVKDWLVSMFDAGNLAPTPVTNLNPKYSFHSYNLRSVMGPIGRGVLNNQAIYPLDITPIGSGSDNFSATNRSGTGTYYRLIVAAGAGAKNVKVLDSSGNPASFTGEHVYVLRIE